MVCKVCPLVDYVFVRSKDKHMSFVAGLLCMMSHQYISCTTSMWICLNLSLWNKSFDHFTQMAVVRVNMPYIVLMCCMFIHFCFWFLFAQVQFCLPRGSGHATVLFSMLSTRFRCRWEVYWLKMAAFIIYLFILGLDLPYSPSQESCI